VLEQLSLNLRACISQRLMKSKGKEGLIPACEVLINTPIVRKLIANGRIDDIQQVLVNQEAGMQTFDQSMAELVREDKTALEEALRYASDEPTFRRLVRGEYSQDDRGGLIGAR
jgi:Tfp pilus assembly ATPase PilU